MRIQIAAGLLLGLAALAGAALPPYPPPPADGSDLLLWADPLDGEPLGQRTPLVMIHGFHTDDQWKPFDPDENHEFDTIRSHPHYPALSSAYKPYLFSYRPFRNYFEIGADLADRLHEHFVAAGEGSGSLVLVAISGGAIPTRVAAADPRLSDRVATIVTMAGANRGSVAAAMLTANRNVRRKIGRIGWFLLKKAVREITVSPGLRSLAHDNFDGAITPWLRDRAGLTTNPQLRAFNRSDPNVGKLIAYFGKRRFLLRRGDRLFGLENELHRRILKKVSRSWKTADPLVHDGSALLAGRPVGVRRIFRGVDHARIHRSKKVLRMLFQDLLQAARGVRARELLGN